MAFEEALAIARDRDVDFILLGGDLFHVNRPSASVEHKCIKLIRQHMNAKCERTTSFSRISGNFSHFSKINHANFEDSNLTVPYPILTIHGNHDDPTGPNAQSVCYKLATCGLLNYFGALNCVDKSIVIEPIVLQKNQVKIALYGLGFIPDYKLKMAFEKGEVIFMEPPRDSFNVLVVHQNRVPHQKHKVIPDCLFPTFFHLIIRGHEHSTESPQPLPESKVNGLVYQPGSTVATSISTMEAAAKKVGLIKVSVRDPNGDQASRYNLAYELIDLKCCRRMIFKDISQKDLFRYIKQTSGGTKVTTTEFQAFSREYVEQCIRDLLRENSSQRESQGSDSTVIDSVKMARRFELPLLRIRLEYQAKKERFDELEVSSKFYPTMVANKDVILFRKQKLQVTELGQTANVTFEGDDGDEEEQDEFEHIDLGDEKRDTIDVMIENYFKDKPAEMRLQALSLTEYTDAVRGSGEDGNVISKVLNAKKKQVLASYRTAVAQKAKKSTEAIKDFHNEILVNDWFIRQFSCQDANQLANKAETGGDIPMEVVICD